jgi:hypothetical protein
VADTDPMTAAAASSTGGPGSASSAHPSDAIPLPAHGFATLDDVPAGELAAVPAVAVITWAAALLMSGSADKLGLVSDSEPFLDLEQARALITALAGLLAASRPVLEVDHQVLFDGLTSLQTAFRAASRYPDEPGQGPGEQYLPSD